MMNVTEANMKLTKNEQAAVAVIDAMESLLKIDAGDLNPEIATTYYQMRDRVVALLGLSNKRAAGATSATELRRFVRHEFVDAHPADCPGCDDGSMMVADGECAGCKFEDAASDEPSDAFYADHPGHSCTDGPTVYRPGYTEEK